MPPEAGIGSALASTGTGTGVGVGVSVDEGALLVSGELNAVANALGSTVVDDDVLVIADNAVE